MSLSEREIERRRSGQWRTTGRRRPVAEEQADMGREECEARGGVWDLERRTCVLGGESKEQLLPWPVTPLPKPEELVPGLVGPDVMENRIEAINQQVIQIEAKLSGILETIETLGYDASAFKRR